MNRSLRKLLLGLAAVLLLPACGKHHHDTNPAPDYGVVVNSIAGLPSDFIKGADVSMLAQIEAKGGKFYDETGAQKDCLKILKSHGVNWVRLRLWNNPVLAHGFTPEPGVNVLAGESAAGINDLARDIALAKRAKALGMKVLLDFHYSDWWADPGKQFVPQAWEDMTLDQMKTALYDFTKDAVTQMRAAGAGPDMVQVGNETTNGMLWPLGRIDKNDPATYDGFVALLGQATKAVRDVDPAIQIVIHIDQGGDNALCRRYYSTLIADGVDFDVIGLSYYPTWHGTMADLRVNLIDISQYFGKPVAIVETAYPWTTDNADSQGNNISGTAMLTVGPYLPTVQGQTTFVRDLMELVSDVPYGRGLGIFYWEPDWIAVAGAGWYTQGGDGWDNQTFFDHDGKALPSLNVFRAVSQDRPWVEATPKTVPTQQPIITSKGAPATLPDTAQVFYSDDSLRPMYVIWDPLDPAAWNTPGSFELPGTIPGSSLAVSLPITVTLVQNPGFETGDTSGWTLTDTDPPAELWASQSNVRSGRWAFHWYDGGSTFDFTLSQVITGLETGKTYQFVLHAIGQSGEPFHANAYCPPSSASPTSTTDFALAGWQSDPALWLEITVGGLDGSAGSCKVEVTTGPAGGRQWDWGSFDDFSVVEVP